MYLYQTCTCCYHHNFLSIPRKYKSCLLCISETHHIHTNSSHTMRVPSCWRYSCCRYFVPLQIYFFNIHELQICVIFFVLFVPVVLTNTNEIPFYFRSLYRIGCINGRCCLDLSISHSIIATYMHHFGFCCTPDTEKEGGANQNQPLQF